MAVFRRHGSEEWNVKSSRAHGAPTEPCLGCGGIVPRVEGPTHRYLEASPGCWETYGRLLAKEYSRRAYWRVHTLTVDAYALQHPGVRSPQTIQSAAVHLIGLCAILERGTSIEGGSKVKARAKARLATTFDWLEPPNSLGDITVVQVSGARDAADHGARVQAWARAVWNAWAPHGDTVRTWVDKLTSSTAF